MKYINCPLFKPTAPKKGQAIADWLSQLQLEMDSYGAKTKNKRCYDELKRYYAHIHTLYSKEVYKGRVKKEIDAYYNTINNNKRLVALSDDDSDDSPFKYPESCANISILSENQQKLCSAIAAMDIPIFQDAVAATYHRLINKVDAIKNLVTKKAARSLVNLIADFIQFYIAVPLDDEKVSFSQPFCEGILHGTYDDTKAPFCSQDGTNLFYSIDYYFTGSGSSAIDTILGDKGQVQGFCRDDPSKILEPFNLKGASDVCPFWSDLAGGLFPTGGTINPGIQIFTFQEKYFTIAKKIEEAITPRPNVPDCCATLSLKPDQQNLCQALQSINHPNLLPGFSTSISALTGMAQSITDLTVKPAALSLIEVFNSFLTFYTDGKSTTLKVQSDFCEKVLGGTPTKGNCVDGKTLNSILNGPSATSGDILQEKISALNTAILSSILAPLGLKAETSPFQATAPSNQSVGPHNCSGILNYNEQVKQKAFNFQLNFNYIFYTIYNLLKPHATTDSLPTQSAGLALDSSNLGLVTCNSTVCDISDITDYLTGEKTKNPTGIRFYWDYAGASPLTTVKILHPDNLNNLLYLAIQHANIVDISFLQQLPNKSKLRTLELGSNLIINLTNFTKFSAVFTLDFGANNIKDLTNLGTITSKLSSLTLNANESITNIQPIIKLGSLVSSANIYLNQNVHIPCSELLDLKKLIKGLVTCSVLKCEACKQT